MKKKIYIKFLFDKNLNNDQIFTELRETGNTLFQKIAVIKTKIVWKQLPNKVFEVEYIVVVDVHMIDDV